MSEAQRLDTRSKPRITPEEAGVRIAHAMTMHAAGQRRFIVGVQPPCRRARPVAAGRRCPSAKLSAPRQRLYSVPGCFDAGAPGPGKAAITRNRCNRLQNISHGLDGIGISGRLSAAMRRLIIACLLLAALTTPALSQTARLRGRLVDRTSKAPVAGAYLRLINLADTTDVRAGGSADNGSFSFSGLALRDYRLLAERIGYAALRQTIAIDRADQDAGSLAMVEVAVPQEGIVVQGSVPTAIQKADTTEFAAQAVKTHRDATAEEMVTKLPGVTIDNGTVKSNGEAVRQVLVDGKPYFGGDATLALRNLPADVVDKIQVYDKMSDQSEWTGFDDGQPVRTMNLTLRGLGLHTQFGKVFAGHGDKDYYSAGGSETNMFARNNNINLRRTGFHARLDLFNFLRERVQACREACRDCGDWNPRTLQRRDRCRHKAMINTHRTRGEWLARKDFRHAQIVQQLGTNWLTRFCAQSLHRAFGVVT